MSAMIHFIATNLTLYLPVYTGALAPETLSLDNLSPYQTK